MYYYDIKSELKETVYVGIIFVIFLLLIVVSIFYKWYIATWVLIIGLMLYILGYLMWYKGYKIKKEYQNSQEWQRIEGKILKKEVINELSWEGKTIYIPSVLYEYTINDERYTSKVITLFKESLIKESHEEAKDILRKIGNLRQVDVYVNPKKYDESYLTNEYYKPYLQEKNRAKDKGYIETLILGFIAFVIIFLYNIIMS